MSKFLTQFNSISLKDKFSELYENINRDNQARIIANKYINFSAKIESLPNSDSYFVDRIHLLESSIKELKAYDWMPNVGKFITETSQYLKQNEFSILVESIKHDLKLEKNTKFYGTTINKLQECLESQNPVFFVLENMKNHTWIPLIKRLYEYCNEIKGNVIGADPRFTLNKIYSPVETINENAYVFYSSNRLFKFENNKIEPYNSTVSNDFDSLVRITESSKISTNQITFYPNYNSILDISFGETTSVKLNNTLIESDQLENILLTGGYVKYGDINKMSLYEMAIDKGNKIKEIDFGYCVKSSVFEGLCVNVFNCDGKVYLQKVNKSMKENSLIECSSASEAITIVKEFMDYDITKSIVDLVKTEQQELNRKNAEIEKINSRIKYILEKISDIEVMEENQGTSEYLTEAKTLLNQELNTQKQLIR